jgi:hypothetical protein
MEREGLVSEDLKSDWLAQLPLKPLWLKPFGLEQAISRL